MKYLIGIDIGTSGTKSVLFDTEGNAVASAGAEYPMYQPENGWAEQDPADWWRAVCQTLKALTEKADGEIVGVGLILQNLFNGEAENNKPFIALMKKHGMPK